MLFEASLSVPMVRATLIYAWKTLSISTELCSAMILGSGIGCEEQTARLARRRQVFGHSKIQTMDYPIEKLTFKEGKIYELYNGKLSNPFMGLCPMQVTKKLSVKERDHHQCEFGFELSCAADPVWVSFFKQDSSDPAVEFQGTRMLLTCLPANLEERYGKIKEAMAKTNVRYEEERQALIGKIVTKDEALKAAQQKREDRTAALNSQFDKLQI